MATRILREYFIDSAFSKFRKELLTMKEWKTRQANSGEVFVRFRKTQASAYKTLQEPWGIRFDIESDPKDSRQSI